MAWIFSSLIYHKIKSHDKGCRAMNQDLIKGDLKSRKKAKPYRVIAVILALLLILSGCTSSLSNDASSQSSIKREDMMSKAIAASGFASTGLLNLPSRAIGAGAFSDYSDLHSNPLQTADYVLQTRKWAGRVTKPTELGAFCRTALLQRGAKLDLMAHEHIPTVDEALTELFEISDDKAGLATAKKQLQNLTQELKLPLARFLSVATSSYLLIKDQTEDVTEEELEKMMSFAYCPPASGEIEIMQTMQSISNRVSEELMQTAGLWMTEVAGELSEKVGKLTKLTTSGEQLTITTPIGNLLFGTAGADTYRSPNTLLLIDPAGNDRYEGKIASGSSLTHPISVVIDSKGNDQYSADRNNGGTQGCGILGVGVLMDLAGNDTYDAVRMVQGCSILGTGVLYDGGGSDSYDCDVTGQGAGFYGMAVLADQSGNDQYHGYGFVQASGGTRCQAYLIDISGDDVYTVDHDVVPGYEGLDYGQFPEINGNWSQGCGWGQRVINLSGGIGGMIDLSGNDSYNGGIWVQGTGYWSGIGFLADSGGDDLYQSCYYSQSSVAHYGVAALVDIGGHDEHTLRSGKKYSGEGASIGFAWDRGVALFVNDGGSDFYTTSQTSGGSAWSAYDDKGVINQDLTYAIFIDTEGFDGYVMNGGNSAGYGRGGYFIDIGGDEYSIPYLNDDSFICYGEEKQEGGVTVNYNKDEGSCVKFWEEAKSATGLLG